MDTEQLYMFTTNKPRNHHFSENTRIITTMNGLPKLLRSEFFHKEYEHWMPFQSITEILLSSPDNKGSVEILVTGMNWEDEEYQDVWGLIPVTSFL